MDVVDVVDIVELDVVDRVYGLLEDEMKTNLESPRTEISFGTSGWRGILGKDVFARSVQSLLTNSNPTKSISSFPSFMSNPA